MVHQHLLITNLFILLIPSQSIGVYVALMSREGLLTMA
jgi:hypothetical protein